jgi:hypothetical protein
MKHPDLEDESPFSHPNAFQDWVRRKSDGLVPYDVVIFAKDGQAAYDRLFIDHHAEFATYAQPSGHVFFRIDDGRFATISNDWENLEDIWPQLDIWNWWDEGQPDLESLREKTELDQIIAGVRYH